MLRRQSLLLLVILAGCSPSGPTIDATTDESLKQSLATITNGMSPEQKEKVEKAAMGIMLQDGLAGFNVESARKKIHAMSADDLLENYRALTLKKQAKEIEDLEARRDLAIIARESLNRFRVTRSRFYFSKNQFVSKPSFEISVHNDTPHAISRAYFYGVLETPGLSVPWVEHDFNYEIPGGLEPGEKATWNLSPNMFGPWSKAPEDRKDMVFVVTPTRIDDAAGNPLYDASQFDAGDEKRLATLREQLSTGSAAK